MEPKKYVENVNDVIIQLKQVYHYFYIECFGIHIFYFILFHYYKIYPLAIVNILVIVAFSMIILGVLKENKNLTLLLIHFGIITHASLCVILFGSSFGFEYIILITILMIAIWPYEYSRGNYIYAVIEIIIYIIFRMYTLYHQPWIADTEMQKIAPYLYISHMLFAFVNFFILAYMSNQANDRTKRIMAESNKELEYLANIDPLTGLFNRRAIFEYIETFQKNNKLNSNYCVAIGDIDNFKCINDTYGHNIGDFVLRKVTDILQNNFDKDTILCRWGGEEILIFMPNTSIKEAEENLRVVREAINKTEYINSRHRISFTMTFGVCEAKVSDSFYDAVISADQGLYIGKNNGKNQVVCIK